MEGGGKNAYFKTIFDVFSFTENWTFVTCYKMAVYASPWMKKMKHMQNLGAHGGYYEECCLLACNAMYFGGSAHCLLFAGFLCFPLTVKIEAVCSSETLVDLY